MQRLFKRNSTMEQSILRTQHHVSKHLVIGHLDVANSDPQAKNFFELELDGGTNFSDLLLRPSLLETGVGNLPAEDK